jgi:hypothetical protein
MSLFQSPYHSPEIPRTLLQAYSPPWPCSTAPLCSTLPNRARPIEQAPRATLRVRVTVHMSRPAVALTPSVIDHGITTWQLTQARHDARHGGGRWGIARSESAAAGGSGCLGSPSEIIGARGEGTPDARAEALAVEWE